MRKTLFLLFPCFFVPFLLETASQELLPRMEKKFQSLRSLQASFQQVYFSQSVSTPLMEKGKFYFQKPDWMRWEYFDPEKKVYLYKEGTLLSYFPDDNQLIKQPLSIDQPEAEILAIFSGRKSLDESYFFEIIPTSRENPLSQQVKLIPKIEGDYSSIVLEINVRTLLIEKAFFYEWTGSRTEFNFSGIKTDIPFPKKVFELEVPPDCEIIEQKRDSPFFQNPFL